MYKRFYFFYHVYLKIERGLKPFWDEVFYNPALKGGVIESIIIMWTLVQKPKENEINIRKDIFKKQVGLAQKRLKNTDLNKPIDKCFLFRQ